MIRLGIIGFGKIAADQHVPAIRGGGVFEFAAAASQSPTTLDGVPTFIDHRRMLAEVELDAVAVCTPPSVRYDLARDCIASGKHVLLEKPPGVTLGEVEALARLATDRGVTLFTTWHAQANAAVTAAADALGDRRIASMEIVWHEDVRKWHPGQEWIWKAGGFGVFDPGINALSIASRLVPSGLIVREAKLSVASNKAMPIAADLTLASPIADGPITASFDFRQVGDERWTIDIRTVDGMLVVLSRGGSRLAINGADQSVDGPGEYPALYATFADLIAQGRSHVDVEPLRVVADAFMMAERVSVDAFED